MISKGPPILPARRIGDFALNAMAYSGLLLVILQAASARQIGPHMTLSAGTFSFPTINKALLIPTGKSSGGSALIAMVCSGTMTPSKAFARVLRVVDFICMP